MQRFRALSFDCYGTLVDWERGIAKAFDAVLRPRGDRRSTAQMLERFAVHEAHFESQTPILPYHDVLERVSAEMAREVGIEIGPDERLAFADSVKDWPLFSDVLPALRVLHQDYVLVILSNVDRRCFQHTLPRFEGLIDLALIAEDTGAYKPSTAAFDALVARLAERGIGRQELLHVAQSLFHDHEPASLLGIASCWVDRRHDQEGWGAVPPPTGAVIPPFRIEGLDELPDVLARPDPKAT